MLTRILLSGVLMYLLVTNKEFSKDLLGNFAWLASLVALGSYVILAIIARFRGCTPRELWSSWFGKKKEETSPVDEPVATSSRSHRFVEEEKPPAAELSHRAKAHSAAKAKKEES